MRAELAICQQRVRELEAAMRRSDSDSSAITALRKELDEYKLRVLQISSEVPLEHLHSSRSSYTFAQLSTVPSL